MRKENADRIRDACYTIRTILNTKMEGRTASELVKRNANIIIGACDDEEYRGD